MAHGRHVKFLVMGRAWDFFMSPLVSNGGSLPNRQMAQHALRTDPRPKPLKKKHKK